MDSFPLLLAFVPGPAVRVVVGGWTDGWIGGWMGGWVAAVICCGCVDVICTA